MLMAPAGTPGPVIDRLHQAIAAYVASAEGQKKLIDMGMIPGAPPPPATCAIFQPVESSIFSASSLTFWTAI
jgi:tripartite-type tricarboxylate transporter receptor subunit TctC